MLASEFAGFIMGALAVALGVWLGRKTAVRSYETTTTGPTVMTTMRKAFAKPSGKHKPKVNDDSLAWRKENDA